MRLSNIADYLDTFLETAAYKDDSVNGLQVESTGDIKKIGFAVDACLEAVQKAAAARCDLLIVHHGLFWGKPTLLRGSLFQRIRSLVTADIALYAVHLPLDAHQEVGNNIQIARRIGLRNTEPFIHYQGRPIGVKGTLKTPQSCAVIAEELTGLIGYCSCFMQCGPAQVSSIGVVAGSATDPDLFAELKRHNIDLFITGEPKHGAYYLAREMDLNIFYGSHYITETFGIKALAAHLEKTLGIATEFIDTPCFLR